MRKDVKYKLSHIFPMILILTLMFLLSACGSGMKSDEPPLRSTVETDNSETGSTESGQVNESSEIQGDTGDVPAMKQDNGSMNRRDVLVAYFSATGTTKGIAEKIAKAENADTYESTAAQAYSSDDLDYNNSGSRTTKEQNDKSARPKIGSEKIDISGYSNVYIGYPIWWGQEPRIMDTFVEMYDFDSITVIPFCTSGSSDIGSSGANLEEIAGSGKWISGERLSGNISDSDLQSWIDGLK